MSFLPSRMTRLLVGGHQDHMAGAIDVLHAEGAVHLEDYQDPTGLTQIGTPLEQGDAFSALLVKVRGLQKALGTDMVRAKAIATSDPDAIFDEAQHVAGPAIQSLNHLRSEAAALGAERTALAPFASFDFPLESLTGLKSVKGFIGTTRNDPRGTLKFTDVEVVPAGAGFAVALFVPTSQAQATERALAEVGFAPAALPARTGTPAQRLAALHNEQVAVQSRLAAAEAKVAALRAEHGARLASLEAYLAREVEKTQAPLQFAVTESTFHLEGWVPRRRVNRVKNALSARFGDSLYIEELGDAPRHDAAPGHHHGRGEHAQEHTGHGASHGSSHALMKDERALVGLAAVKPAVGTSHGPSGQTGTGPDMHGEANHGGNAGAEGGHHATDAKDEPPIHLDNKGPAKPYEFLLGLLGKPRYNEIDPTKLMLIFFPLFFGLMVGDLLVGIIIAVIGWWMKTNKIFGIGGPAVGRALVMGGVMAAIVGGIVFGEALGIHFVTPEPHEEGEEKEISWEAILGITIPSEGFLLKTGAHIDEAGHDDGHANGTTDGEHAEDMPITEGNDTVVAHGQAGGINGDLGSQGSEGFTPLQEDHEVVPEEEAEGGGVTAMLKPHSDVHLSVNGWFNLGYYSKIHDIQALLVWSLLIGFVHLVLGLVLGVRNVYVAHGTKLAIQEKVSWLLLIAGVIVLVMGITGGSTAMLVGGVLVAVFSVGLLWAGAAHTLGVGFIAILEVPSLAGNLLSYTRLAAIGASKAGMALAFAAIGFDTLGGGDIHSVVGWAVYLLGFLLLIVLSILAGSLQSLRLQFVEFFSKFYQGGGRPYVPFGRRAP